MYIYLALSFCLVLYFLRQEFLYLQYSFLRVGFFLFFFFFLLSKLIKARFIYIYFQQRRWRITTLLRAPLLLFLPYLVLPYHNYNDISSKVKTV